MDTLPPATQRLQETYIFLAVAMSAAVFVGLATLCVFDRTFCQVGRSGHPACTATGAVIRSQVELFQVDCRPVVPTDTLGSVIWTRPPDVAADEWRGPYLSRVGELLDPWGNVFILQVPGTLNPDGFDIVSYGADGVAGGVAENGDIRR